MILLSISILSCKSSSVTPTPGVGGSGSTETSSSLVNFKTTAADWSNIFDGFGSISYNADTGIVLQPKASTVSGETHATLVLAKITETCPIKDFILTIVATTESQLRSGTTPNAWEVFWIFFNFLYIGSEETSNYFILKPNGIELGRAEELDAQTFLYTAEAPLLTIGKRNTFVVEKTGGHLEISIDGAIVLSYDGGTFPNALYDRTGSIGLYTEDARVRIHSISLESDELVSGGCL